MVTRMVYSAVINRPRAGSERHHMAKQLKKLTLEVPADLLERATTASGEGVTPTVRRGLELVAAGGAYGRLRRFRGKVKFGVRLSELRLD
jgi:hypothetical protein